MILETKRLRLREITQTDYKALSQILQDEETMYAYEGAFSDKEVQEWLDRQIRRYKKMGFRPMGRHTKRNRRFHRPMRTHHAALERPRSTGNRLPVLTRPLAQRLRHRSSKSLQKIRLRNPKSPRSLLHHPRHKHTLPKSSPPKRNAPHRPLDQTI